MSTLSGLKFMPHYLKVGKDIFAEIEAEIAGALRDYLTEATAATNFNCSSNPVRKFSQSGHGAHETEASVRRALATHRRYNNTQLLHSAPAYDKPLRQCAERRNLPCSRAPCRMRTHIVAPVAMTIEKLNLSGTPNGHFFYDLLHGISRCLHVESINRPDKSWPCVISN